VQLRREGRRVVGVDLCGNVKVRSSFARAYLTCALISECLTRCISFCPPTSKGL